MLIKTKKRKYRGIDTYNYHCLECDGDLDPLVNVINTEVVYYCRSCHIGWVIKPVTFVPFMTDPHIMNKYFDSGKEE